MSGCLKCGDTGILTSGAKCDCGVGRTVTLPECANIPAQYVGVEFSKEFVPQLTPSNFGQKLESILEEILEDGCLRKNYLLCSPPNTGKTVFAYTVAGSLFAAGINMPMLIDLAELRQLYSKVYTSSIEKWMEYSEASVVILKIPPDIPTRFVEIMSTVVERRVRNGYGTIFLFSGNLKSLESFDTFGKLQYLKGTGHFNSIEFNSWWKE